MKYAVISDVHANLMALDKVLEDAERNGAETVVCLGDVVGYGPLPAETLHRVCERADIVIAGNHDDAVSGRISADDFIDLAADAVKRHREQLSEEEIAWLRSLPYTAQLEGAIAAHGDFTDPRAFRYMKDPATVISNLGASNAQLMFVGHTHVPGVYLVGKSGKLYWIDPEDFTLEDKKRYIVNPGSVGYPRDASGECYSSYVLYDSTVHTIQFRLLPFTVASVMQRGANPKPMGKRIVIAAVIGAALVSGGLALWLAPNAERVVERERIQEMSVYADDPALNLDRKSLTLPKTARAVQAGLKLDKGDQSLLRVVFFAADGSEIKRDEKTVKLSGNDRWKVPDGAVSVDFIVRRLAPDESPKIKAFNPCWR